MSNLNYWQERTIANGVAIDVLDKQILTANQSITILQAGLTANDTAISTLQANVSANTTAISALQISVSANTTAISTLQANVENNSNSISANDTAISTINTSLTEMSHKVCSDFFYDAAAATSPWAPVAIASGTKINLSGTQKHPGVLQLQSSTSANSGIVHRLALNCFLLAGSESTTETFKTADSQTTITRRMGFHNSVDSSAPADGVYAKIVDGTLTGQTSNNSTGSTTATNYALANGTYYRLKIVLNSNATLATFTLYADDSDTVLWTDTLSTNIPTARATGHADVCTSSGTTAITLGYLDYMDIVLPHTRKV